MWRTIISSKNNIKQLHSIHKPKVVLNISTRKTEVLSNRLIYVYTFKNLNKSSNINDLTQFARTFASNNGKINQKSLKEPLNTTSEPKQKPKYDFEQLKKLIAIFLSGCAAYFAISYALDMKDGSKKNNQLSNEDFINYESKNLPGKVKISKSVNINL